MRWKKTQDIYVFCLVYYKKNETLKPLNQIHSIFSLFINWKFQHKSHNPLIAKMRISLRCWFINLSYVCTLFRTYILFVIHSHFIYLKEERMNERVKEEESVKCTERENEYMKFIWYDKIVKWTFWSFMHICCLIFSTLYDIIHLYPCMCVCACQ